jgi:hypothetical protein
MNQRQLSGMASYQTNDRDWASSARQLPREQRDKPPLPIRQSSHAAAANKADLPRIKAER